MEVPPVVQASSSGARIWGSTWSGNRSGTTDEDTTFAPEARMRAMSSIASVGRRSAVAV